MSAQDRSIADLLASLCDETISSEEMQRLDGLLCSDASARRLYLEYLDLHARLSFQGGTPHGTIAGGELEAVGRPPWASGDHGQTAEPLPSSFGRVAGNEGRAMDECVEHSPSAPPVIIPSLPISQSFGSSFVGGPLFSYLIAAVLMASGLLVAAAWRLSDSSQVTHYGQSSSPFAASRSHRASAVGQITGMVDCRWEGPGVRVQGSGAANQKSEITNHHSLLRLGDRLSLKSGLLEITYDTGAKVILQGPVTYEVESPTGGYLSVGKLTAKLEKTSEVRGQRSESANQKSEIINQTFAVRTPTAIVTDLGTEFGVEVSRIGHTQVHVFQGVVETCGIDPSTNGELRKRLVKGEAVEIGQWDELPTSIAFAPQSFARTLPQSPVAADAISETAYMKAVLADKPIGYWPLNETAGSRKFRDRSGGGADGYAMGKVLSGQPGPLGGDSRAIALDGNAYIDFGWCNRLAMKNDFTVEAWLWIDKAGRHSTPFAVVGAKDNKTLGWGPAVGHPWTKAGDEGPAVLHFITFGAPAHCSYFPLPSREAIEKRWIHVAMAFDASNAVRLYLNGEARGAVQSPGPATAGEAWFNIGCAELVDDDFWHGRIAHVAIYPRTLSLQQIQAHTASIPRNPQNKE